MKIIVCLLNIKAYFDDSSNFKSSLKIILRIVNTI